MVDKSLQVEFDPQDAAEYPVNAPADSVGLTLHAEASAMVCPTGIVQTRAQSALASGLAAGEALSPASVAFHLEENARGGIDLLVTGLAVKVPDPNAMVMALRARTPGEAGAILQSRFGAHSVVGMERWPGWIPVLPLFPYQIEIDAGAE